MGYSTQAGAVISFTVEGTETSRRQIDGVAQSFGHLGNVVQSAMRSAVAAVGTTTAVVQLARTSDAYAKFTAQLRLATGSQREYAFAYDEVRRIAKDSQQDLGATGILYSRIASGTRDLHLSQQRVAAITEVVNLGLKVSGATAQESASAQLQLSQAFAAGALRGEEFNAVNEAAPAIMEALASGMGVARGQLKQMAEDGKITAEVMADVLPRSLAKLRDEAAQVQTISGAVTVLKNEFTEFIGQQAEASGAVSVLTSGIGLLANNLQVLTSVAIGLGASKLAQTLIESGRALYGKASAAVASVAASQAERTATIASTAAEVQRLQAVVASVTAERAKVVAQLESARATMAATQAMGAQSTALAMHARASAAASVAMGELVALGRLQTTTNQQLAASQAALNAVTSSGGAAAGLAARALGFLGGPIGAVTTVLGIGATAWMLWGNNAEAANAKAKDSTVESSAEIIAELDKQIEKNEAIIRLRQAGLSQENALGRIDINKRLTGLSSDLVMINKGMYGGRKLNSTEQFFERERVMKSILELTTKMQRAETSAEAAKAATQQEERIAFLREYATKQEQVNTKIEEWKKRLGSSFTAADEARIRKHMESVDDSLTGFIRSTSTARRMSAESLQLEYRMYGKTSDARDVAAIGLKNEANLQEFLTGEKKKGHAISDGELKRLKDEVALRTKVEQSTLAQAKALGYARSLADENTKFAVEYIVDEKERARALLQIDAELWQERIRLAGDGTKAQKLLQEEYALWYQNQLAKPELEANRRLWQSIEQTAHDTFISIADSGKNAFDRLRDTLKNGLMDMLYQMTVKKWIIQLQTSMGSGGGIGGMFSNFAGMFGSGGGGASGGMGGAGAIGGAGSFSAVPIIGWIAAGMAMANSMYKQGWDAQNGSLTDSYGGKAHMPFNAPMLHLNTALQKLGMNNQMANMFSGASTVARLFGRKNPEVERHGLQGSFGAGGFSGGTYAEIVEKGGLFRSSKRYTQSGQMDAEAKTVFSDTIKMMMTSTKEFGAVLGLQTAAIDGYSKQIKLELTNDEEKNKELISKMFGGIGDELAQRLLPTIGQFKLTGETAAETLQRVATNYRGLDQILRGVGMEFGAVGVQSIAARERLVKLTGGLETLAAQAESFAQNYLTEAERLDPVRKYVAQEMTRLGYASVDTRDEFKALVLGLDLTTEAGAQLYADLMKIQEAFAQVHPAIGGALSLADATNAVADSFRRAEDSARAGIERYTAFGASIRDLIDSTKLGSMSPLTPEQKYAEAEAQYKATAAAALMGDAAAQARYRDVHDAWLQISQTVNGGDGKFVADYMVAQANNQQLLAYSAMQITVEQAALDAARAQVSGILAVEQAVLSLPEALAQYFTAGGAQPGAQLPPVPAPAPAPSSGQLNQQSNAALLAELQELRKEVAGLRADQQQQTGDLIKGQYDAADRNAEQVGGVLIKARRESKVEEALA